jgi:UDP-N-acetylmuramyl pentapeptide phosphotransferase/UDP-N-acetylglucosamine-1-phosphate transferase
LAVHFVSVVLVLYQLGFVGFPWWGWVLGFVLIIGWLNNFNFMDGINGITVLYALSVFIPLYWTNSQLDILPSDLLVFVGFSLMIFGFYNLRKKARTFSGDVGSISLGLLIAFCIATLIIATHNWQYILWVVIYGLDSVITIIERLLRRENIFEAHRSHLYQYLANEMKVPHVVVSMIYAVLQLAISALVMYMLDNEYGSGYYVALFVSLGILYLLVKKSIKSKINIE